MATDENSQRAVVCVLFYPEEAEQAEVYFVDLTKWKAAKHLSSDDQDTILGIETAMADKNEMSTMDYGAWSDSSLHKYSVSAPCFVKQSVTVFLS